MKGLIIKDLYMIKNYCKSYLLFLVIFLIMPLVSREQIFLSAYLFLLPSMTIISLLSYDEKNNWETYFEQLPVTPKNYVSTKYLLGTILLLIILVIYSLGLYFRYDISFFESIKSMSLVACLSFAITLPFYFRYGSHIGRIAYYVSLGIVVVIAMNVQFTFIDGVLLEYLDSILCVLGICLFIGSYFLSQKLYKIRLNKQK